MKKLLTAFLCFFALISSAQSIVTDTSVIIKPFFILGETRTYLVTEDCKIESGLLFPVNAESQYKIVFKILDTAKGYTISYSVQTIKTSNKRWAMESLKAKVSDNINFIYRLSRDGWVVDLFNFNRTKRQLLNRLDSVAAIEKFSEIDQKGIKYLRRDIENGRAVEGFMKPLMLFNDLFTKPPFRNRKDFVAVNRWDIFYQAELPGVMILELKDANKKTGIANVAVDFIGNRDSMAKYANLAFQEVYSDLTGKPMKYQPAEAKNDFKRDYTVMLDTGWPILITNKVIEFYLQRITYKTKITLVRN
jgi:hypothetical protein